MSSLSERLAAARREASVPNPAYQPSPEVDQPSSETDRTTSDWDSLADMARDIHDRLDRVPVEDSPEEPELDQDSPDANDSESEGSESDDSTPEEDSEEQETERISRIDRMRAKGAAALESMGVAAYGRLSAITDRMQARDDRRQEAQEDYDNAMERPIDQLLTDDKEILGEHARGLFRDRARKKADGLVDKISHAEDVKDTVTMREKFIEAKKNFTQVKIDKLQAKIDNSPDNFFTRRLNGWRREKLRDMKAVNKKRTSTIDKIENKRQEKPEVLRKKIDALVKKKIDAMYKKAQRVELRSNGIGKRNMLKRHEFLAKLTAEDKKRIVREAIFQVRKKNIELGRLSSEYSPDNVVDEENTDIRKVADDYGRIVE